jgi:hypothetical protein
MRTPSDSIIYLKKAIDVYLLEKAKHKRNHSRGDILDCFKDLSVVLHQETANKLELAQSAIDFDSKYIQSSSGL